MRRAKHRPLTNRHMSDHMRAQLAKARLVPLREAEGHNKSPATIASLIATGKLTRDRACDGKKRYATYGYAIEVRNRVKEQLGKTQECYACPFCGGFHAATVREITS